LRSFCDILKDLEGRCSDFGFAERPSEILDVRDAEACSMMAFMSNLEDRSGDVPHGRPGSRGDGGSFFVGVAGGALLTSASPKSRPCSRSLSCQELRPTSDSLSLLNDGSSSFGDVRLDDSFSSSSSISKRRS